MAAAAGVLNHQTTSLAEALKAKAAAPMDNSTSAASGSSGSDSSTSGNATISANDFLTLLVTEMQNQDPTADTDPNEYIDQLVNVNSLEQLIDINQTLSTDLGSTSSSTTTSSSSQVARTATGVAGASSGAGTTQSPAAATGSLTASPLAPAGVNAQATQSTSGHVAGNLSVPGASIASRRVAH